METKRDVAALKPIVELTQAEKSAIDEEIKSQIESYSENFLNIKALYMEVKALKNELLQWGIDERKKYIEETVKEKLSELIISDDNTPGVPVVPLAPISDAIASPANAVPKVAAAAVANQPTPVPMQTAANESAPVSMQPIANETVPVTAQPIANETVPVTAQPPQVAGSAASQPTPAATPKAVNPIAQKQAAPKQKKKRKSGVDFGFIIILVVILVVIAACMGYLVDKGVIGNNSGFVSRLLSNLNLLRS